MKPLLIGLAVIATAALVWIAVNTGNGSQHHHHHASGPVVTAPCWKTGYCP